MDLVILNGLASGEQHEVCLKVMHFTELPELTDSTRWKLCLMSPLYEETALIYVFPSTSARLLTMLSP